jgi:hypothetical protein
MMNIGAFWNIRDMNKSGRNKCLGDFIRQNKFDFVGIQETKKRPSVGDARQRPQGAP